MKYLPAGAGDWQHCPGYNKKPLLDAEDLAAAGSLVQLIEIPPKTAVAPHFHDHCTEVFHVTSGRGRFVIDGQVVDLVPGDTLTCQPGEVHSTENPGEEVFAYVVFKTNAQPGDITWMEDKRDD